MYQHVNSCGHEIGTPGTATPVKSASVILCAFSTNRFPLLISAVESVRWQSVTPAEIIVVIDHNLVLLEQMRALFPDLAVIANSGPRGLAGARNTGTAAASGEVVVFLDDDAVADPGWLQALSVHFARPEVLGVGGHPVATWETGRPRWWPDEFDWVVGCGHRGLPTVAAPVRNLSGCAMSLRREVVLKADGFDTSLGLTAAGANASGEPELRLSPTELFPGGVLLHDPAARVRHHVPAARTTLRYFCSRCFAEGVSKRMVARRAGTGPRMAPEVTHPGRTLPGGFVRHLSAGARGDLGGPLRAATIVVGAATTMGGCLLARAPHSLAEPAAQPHGGAGVPAGRRRGVARAVTARERDTRGYILGLVPLPGRGQPRERHDDQVRRSSSPTRAGLARRLRRCPSG